MIKKHIEYLPTDDKLLTWLMSSFRYSNFLTLRLNMKSKIHLIKRITTNYDYDSTKLTVGCPQHNQPMISDTTLKKAREKFSRKNKKVFMESMKKDITDIPQVLQTLLFCMKTGCPHLNRNLRWINVERRPNPKKFRKTDQSIAKANGICLLLRRQSTLSAFEWPLDGPNPTGSVELLIKNFACKVKNGTSLLFHEFYTPRDF